MLKALGAGVFTGVALGYATRRWLDGKGDVGPRGAIGSCLDGGLASVPQALLQATGTEIEGGNDLTLCNDGQVFDAIEEAVREARRSIHIDVFIWKPGDPGSRLAELVMRRAGEGIAVRILVDPIGSTNFDKELFAPLREAGCEVEYFRPPRKRPFSLISRNHRKIVVVDGKIAITGGFGIAKEWTGDGHSPGHWRDTNVRIQGPTVRQLQLAFAAHWLEVGGRLLPAVELARPVAAGDADAGFVTSMDVKGLSSARWVTHIALASARQRAWISNAYFVPPPQVIHALCEQSAAGVDVRLLLPGPHQDHPTITFIQHRLFPKMKKCGVCAYEYQPSMMHAKTMLIDDRLVVVGSINLDLLSQELLEEGALVVLDERFAQAMERRWEQDIARSNLVMVGDRQLSLPA